MENTSFVSKEVATGLKEIGFDKNVNSYYQCESDYDDGKTLKCSGNGNE